VSNDVREWIDQLQQGEPEAAQRVWEQYFGQLVRLAQRKMGALPRRVADEEDVALSAMNSFVQGARAGKFPRLDDETDLWRLLVTITARKVVAQRRRHFAARRNHGKVRGESIFVPAGGDSDSPGIGAVVGETPTPAFAAEVADECRTLFDKLDDPLLREIARWKMEGFSNEEIAGKLSRTERTVERKLVLIRELWSVETDNGPV
jgi:DNA-directed RNA polymerase specialized sigma24 family protein